MTSQQRVALGAALGGIAAGLLSWKCWGDRSYGMYANFDKCFEPSLLPLNSPIDDESTPHVPEGDPVLVVMLTDARRAVTISEWDLSWLDTITVMEYEDRPQGWWAWLRRWWWEL